ncbi:MAG: sugar-binding domain-containing protein [Flavisolibacter sp.]
MQKKIVSFLFFFFILVSSHAQRSRYNFNPGWKVFVGDNPAASQPDFNDAGWKKITLPYAWNEDDAFKKDIADLSTGIAWYRKHFKIPVERKGQKIFLEFEGIRQAGEFYLNGKPIGLHENGVMAFGFDISALVRFDEENILAVRIDNDWDYKEKSTHTKFEWEDRNFNANYGSITKNVYLHFTPIVYQTLSLFSNLQTTGVYVWADEFDIAKKMARVHAQSEVKNETDLPQDIQYTVHVFDIDHKLVKSFTGDKTNMKPGEKKILQASAQISGLNFWSWGYGYLYDVQTCLVINGKESDSVTTKTGFRKTEFKDGMIYLNDRVIQIHGYGQRTTNEWPAIGQSVPAWMSDYSNGLMVEGNANLVRWMHITPWKQDIESCDRVGLMEAMPAGDAEKDVDGIRWEQRKALMRDAIIYNRNNPSIIFYECGNKAISEKHMKEMKEIRDAYDPTGGRAIGAREMLDSKTAEYGGEMLYINKSAHVPLWAMEYSRDEGSRKYWDDYSPPYHKDGNGPLLNGESVPEYNHNQESHAIENVVRWYDFWKERPGTGKRVSSGGVNIIFSETNTHHRGAENYRRSGEVDALRIFKQNYFANQVMWDGWVDTEHPRIHIIGHWNYEKGLRKNMYVVSSADKVELKRNRKSLGWGRRSNHFLFEFDNVEWEPGVLTATGYDENNHPICSTEIKTSGPAYSLKLKVMTGPAGLLADGHDLALVEVEVVDEEGNICPTALDFVKFSLSGAAEWRGGMAMGPDNFILSKDLPVECGVNRVLIRSLTKAGNIQLTASAVGLKPAILTLSSHFFPVGNGYSKILPGSGLAVHLERGPTPQTPSFKRSRSSVAIIHAVAGAHSDSAFASYDDNELTDWVNDGKLSTAWIEYQLERPAMVSEVSLKLNNFRSRSYFLSITVDGIEVFRDSTERNLGYFHAGCTPHKGSKVRIRLLQPSKEQNDPFLEVSGKKLDDGVPRDDATAKGRLSIIEAEIFESEKKSE